MRIDQDECRDPELLAAEVRRLQAVIAAGDPTLTAEERGLKNQECQVFVQKNLTLTAAERETLELAIDQLAHGGFGTATLRTLLERTQ